MALASIPIAKIFGNYVRPSEDLLGYGSLSIILSVVIIILSIGFLLGLASIYRIEKFKTLSLLATLLNGLSLLGLLLYLST